MGTIRSSVDDRSIVIKKADKGSCVMVWDKDDNVLKAEKHFSGPSIYRHVNNSKNILPKLSEASKKMFSSLRRKGFKTKKQLKYFLYG